MEKEFQNLLKHFYEFARRRIGFDKPASINFVSDPRNSLEPLGKTAYYNPGDFSITIYTDNRHPKDILRSVAHELVHHKQNCNGQMNNLAPTEPGYAQSDKHLRGLEEEAYLEGNMCFRDWEDEYKTNQEVKTIYESVRKSFIKEKLKMSNKDDLRKTVTEAVTKVLTENRLKEMGYDDYDDYDDDPYMSDLEKEFPFLKDDPRKARAGKAPADIQRAMDDEMPVMDDDEEEMMEGACPKCGTSSCNCSVEEDYNPDPRSLPKFYGQKRVTIPKPEPIDQDDDMEPNLDAWHEEEEERRERYEEATDVSEDASEETFKMLDVVTNAIGHEAALEAVVQAMSRDEAKSNLEYIIRMYELGDTEDLEEKSTEKYDDNAALKGGQDELPDHLQKAIIDAEEEVDEAIEDDIASSEDRYGDMKHIIPGVRFTGDIETDVRAMEENEELGDWLYGELGSGDVVTDSEGNAEYAGADVQDYLNTIMAPMPNIAETQEDFYTQMRKDARTISEDWNKAARNKRSALLNERLMKAWNFKK